MDSYAATGQINVVTAAPGDTALALFASALTRARIHFFLLGAAGVPVADNVLEWFIRRFNAVGTSTAVVPVGLDPGAPASQLAAGENFTAEPTYTVELFDIPVHQRSTFQWNAAPGRGEIVLPAIAANGVGITPIHGAYVSTAQAVMQFQE